ncbi:MAG: hypothetical protein VW443_09695 [Pseudomonadales bacterium]
MPLLPVEQIGDVGIHTDPPSYSLPPNTWSNGVNVRFTDRGVMKMPGYKEVLKPMRGAWTTFPSDKGTPMHIVFRNASYESDDQDMWFVFTESHIMTYLNERQEWKESAVITTASTVDDIWSTAWNGPILLATNGKIMYQLVLNSSRIPGSNPSFTKWYASAQGEHNQVFTSIGTFKSHIIGMGTVASNRSSANPYRVWWSTAMGAYEQVGSGINEVNQFDYMDDTKDAGDFELNETRGKIIGGAQLGDGFMVYKEDCAYVMNYIGQPFIFGFKVMAKDVGLLNKRALAVFDGGHVFVGINDVHLNNGQSIVPLLADKLQTKMFLDMNQDMYQRVFVVSGKKTTEFVVFWPSADATKSCDRGIIWNWLTNTLTLFDPQNPINHACEGIAPKERSKVWGPVLDFPDLYTEYGGTWDEATTKWNEDNYGMIAQHLVLADGVNKKFYQTHSGEKADTEDMFSWVERTGYDLGDPGGVKFVRAVYPKMEVQGTNTVDVYVCGQMSPDSPVAWEGPYPFNPDTQSKVSCRVSGKYFGVKFQTTGDFTWRLHGYEFDMEQAGRRGSRQYAV